MTLPRKTQSICPECFKVLDAEVFIDSDNKVKMRKTCDEHGAFIDLYTFSDPALYAWAEQYAREGVGLANPASSTVEGCP